MSTAYVRTPGTSHWTRFVDGSTLSPSNPSASKYTTAAAVDAGGFYNCGDISPFDADIRAAGADVGGMSISVDGGLTWSACNGGLNSTDKLRICAVRFSVDVRDPDRVWIYTTGWNGSANNFIMTGVVDREQGVVPVWTVHRKLVGGWAAAQSGAQDGDSLVSQKSGHPRQSKNRGMELDPAYIYTISANGVWRTSIADGTLAETRIWGADGDSATCLSIDPNDPDVMYITSDLGTKTGVHRVSGIRGTASVVSHTAAWTGYAQSCKAVSRAGVTYLFVASGKACSAADPSWAVAMWAGAGAFTSGWTDISGTVSDDETGAGGFNRWSGLDVVVRPSGSFRLVVSNSYDGSGNGTRVAWADWSGSGAVSWTKPVKGSNTYDTVMGTSSTWWMALKLPSLMAHAPGFDSVCPVIAPTRPDEFMLFGRSGVWGFVPALGLRPAVRGLMAVSSLRVGWHPSVEGRAIAMDIDWFMHKSLDGFATQPIYPSDPSGATIGLNWSVDADGNVAVCGGAEKNANTNGGVWVSSDFWKSTGATVFGTSELITGTNAPFTTVAGTAAVIGCALGWTSSAKTTQCLLVAVRNAGECTDTAKTGLWRKVKLGSTGVWTQLSLPGQANPFNTAKGDVRAHFAWEGFGAGAAVWLNDSTVGTWRSLDYGATWTQVYAWTATGADASYSGHIVWDPTRTGKLYFVCKRSEAWKVTGANTSSSTKSALLTAANAAEGSIASFTSPAAVTVNRSTGRVYVAQDGASPSLWAKADPWSDADKWVDETTPQWPRMMSVVRDLAASGGSSNVLLGAPHAGFTRTVGVA